MHFSGGMALILLPQSSTHIDGILKNKNAPFPCYKEKTICHSHMGCDFGSGDGGRDLDWDWEHDQNDGSSLR